LKKPHSLKQRKFNKTFKKYVPPSKKSFLRFLPNSSPLVVKWLSNVLTFFSFLITLLLKKSRNKEWNLQYERKNFSQ